MAGGMSGWDPRKVFNADKVFGKGTKKEDAETKKAIDDMEGYYDIPTPDYQNYSSDEFEWLKDYQPTDMVNPVSIDGGSDVDYQDIGTSLADTNTIGRSAFEDINSDPRLKEEQMGAIAALQSIVDGGGATLQDKANLNKLMNQVGQQDKSNRDAILQNANARGMGGSGLEVLAQLQSSQAATNRASDASLDIAAQQQQRALDAIMNKGNLAGSVRNQDFSEASTKANAADAISRFNSGELNNTSKFNAGAKNQTGQFNAGNNLRTDMYNRDTNLGTQKFNAGMTFDADRINSGVMNDANKFNTQGRQGTANANVDVRNKDKGRANDIASQTFNDKMKIAAGKSGTAGTRANYWQGMGDRKAAQGAANQKLAIDAATMAAEKGPAIAAMMSDENSKKDVKKVEDRDIEELLNAISPKEFKYKAKYEADSGTDGGDRVGFMAQDIEGTKLGKEIVQEKGGMKEVDIGNLLGAIVASLGHLAKKGK